MESERLPRGADPNLHTKLGRGGLTDVEWVVQLLQMQHAERRARTADDPNPGRPRGGPRRRASSRTATPRNSRQRGAWPRRSATRVMLVRGRPSDMVPIDVRELRAVAFVLGYPVGDSGRLLEDYRRVTRRARQVFERLFYGLATRSRRTPRRHPRRRADRQRVGGPARRCARPRRPTRRRTRRAAGRPPSATSPGRTRG